MSRPESSLEKFIKRFANEHALLAGLLKIILFVGWVLVPTALGVSWGGGVEVVYAFGIVTLSCVALYYTFLWGWHRIEHAWWYKRKYPRLRHP